MAPPPLLISFEAGPLASLDVLSLHLDERCGRPAVAVAEIRTTTYAEPDDLLGIPARIAFGRGSVEHQHCGLVTSVAMASTPDDAQHDHLVYHVEVTSSLAILEQQVDCRIFQDKDVKEIVSEVLAGFGIAAAQQSWRLTASYPKRDQCVQYNESALAFVSRLLEEEGIFFFSEAGDEGEVLVFKDDSTTSDPIDGDKTLPYVHRAGLEADDHSVSFIRERYRTATGKVSLRDYDFNRPSLDLTVAAAASGADANADLEVYDYPGLYAKTADGQRLAQVKLEALQAERVTLELGSACSRLAAGRYLSLEDTPNEVDGDYLITSAVHDVEGGLHRVLVTVIPLKTKFRSPQITPRPVIDGPQTAVVVAPPGSNYEEIHTDSLGRVKVRFHWDRYAKDDDTASFWARTSQQQTSGSMILPRVGWEVVVEFLEGNPDRPIITGRMFNGRFMPPFALPEGKSRTSLQTNSSPGGGGTNGLRLEDKAGSEEVKFQSQKDTTLATANNKTTSVGTNATKNVKVNATLVVGADQTVKVTNGYKDTVGAAQSTSVGGNRTLEVNAVYGLTSGGASATTVGGNQFEMDGDPLQALLALAVKAATDAAKAEAAQAMQQLDQAVSSKVNDVMGPINGVIGQANQVGAAMNDVSNGNLGAAAGAVSAASGIPMPAAVGSAMQAAGGGGSGAAGPVPNIPTVSVDDASSQLGIDKLVNGAIDAGAGALGNALGVGGGGGDGQSLANTAGPAGGVGGNSAADSATGPGHAINECSSTHAESVGSVKVTIAAAGIHTTIKGARTHDVGAARVELVAGTRAETCQSDKTESALGLVVISSSPESETCAARTTMVGGAILEKIGGSHTVTATGKAMFIGAFHKIDASSSIVFKCGSSEVVIDGGGVAIKSKLVTITAPNVTLTKTVSEA